MKRRTFFALAGGATIAGLWPLAVRSQHPLPTIGYLAIGTLEKTRDIVAGVQDGLADTGFVEGRNLTILYRWAEYHPELVPALFADLVQRRVTAIIMFTQPPLPDVKAASRSIPIVGFFGFDPVATGLVTSLSRPSGNITGVSVLNSTLLGKRLEILHELVPTAKLIAYLGGVNHEVTEAEVRALQAAASTVGIKLSILNANSPEDFDYVFKTIGQSGAGALFVGQDALLQRNSDRLAALANQHRMPAIYASRQSAIAGGLISYGTRYSDAYRILGSYAGRILKGERPADLPVQQVTKLELVINLKAAKELGLTLPSTLLARADEVIE